jgi:hypothetical protein
VFLDGFVNLDTPLLEGSAKRLELLGLELVRLGERLDLVRADDTVLAGVFEQRLNFRGLQDGADGDSFLCRNGRSGSSPRGGA